MEQATVNNTTERENYGFCAFVSFFFILILLYLCLTSEGIGQLADLSLCQVPISLKYEVILRHIVYASVMPDC